MGHGLRPRGRRGRRAAIKAYLAAPYSYIVRQRAAQLHELMGQHANVAGSVIANLSYGLNSILALLVFMISALVLDPTATVVFFLLGTLSIVGLRPLLRWTKGVAKRLADRSIDLGVTVEETTGVVREIKTLGVRKAFEARFEEEVAALATYSRNLNFSLSTTPQVYIGLGVLVLLAAFAAAARFSDGSFATLGGTALLLFRALSYGQQMSGVQQRLSRAHPYAAALNGFIDEARAAGKEVSSGTISLSAIDTIEFVDTSFLYDLGEAPAVKNASFKLERPGLIAVVGPSGTGKTTVAHLALGLLQPTGGDILLNGVPMRDIDGANLAGLVALVPQEPVILHATVLDNIRFYRTDISDERVIEVAKSVGIHETIMALESGYKTELGATTRDLSGGQRQRIVIARALSGDPSMIILDEPTSALDHESESWVMDTLARISQQALTLVIAHRKETIDKCDAILRFDEGELVELVDNH